MFIDRQAIVPDTSMPVAQLRENCMGCADCKGACMDLIELHLLPEILMQRREERP